VHPIDVQSILVVSDQIAIGPHPFHRSNVVSPDHAYRFDVVAFAFCNTQELPAVRYALFVESWSKRRRLFLVELIIFEACVVVGIVLLLTGSGFARALTIAVALVAVMIIHMTMRLTYFKSVLPDLRRQRENGRPPS
jgi:hypothetical protein